MKAPWLPHPFIHHPHPTFTPPSLNHHPLLSFSTFLTLPSPPSLSCQLKAILQSHHEFPHFPLPSSSPTLSASQPTGRDRFIMWRQINTKTAPENVASNGLVLGILTVVSFPKLFIRHASLATASWGFTLHYYQGFCQHQAVNIIKNLFLMDSAG